MIRMGDVQGTVESPTERSARCRRGLAGYDGAEQEGVSMV